MLFLRKKALSAQKMTVFATLSPTATSLVYGGAQIIESTQPRDTIAPTLEYYDGPERAANQSITLGAIGAAIFLMALNTPALMLVSLVLNMVGLSKAFKGLKSKHRKSRRKAVWGMMLNLICILLPFLLLFLVVKGDIHW
jgi:heme O synthase-like polyprenyltransferase